MNKKNRIKILLIVLVFVVAGIVYSCAAAAKKGADVKVTEEETSSLALETEETTEEDVEICVHVCGCVQNPGVYYLRQGARIHEAVEEAGGMTADADRQYVNLAKEAEDGAQIYIPSMEEVEEGFSPEMADPAVDDGLVNINTASVEELKNLPGIGEIKAEAIVTYRETSGAFSSIEEIMNVAGIKESSYERIKDYIKV